MVDFGYALGDFIAVGKLAWTVYKAYRGAPDSFNNISSEILSLHALLKEIEESVLLQPMGAAQKARLKAIYDGCNDVLRDLQALIGRYESLSIKNKFNWDRFGWGTQDIAEYRSRITSNVGLLGAFLRSVSCLSMIRRFSILSIARI